MSLFSFMCILGILLILFLLRYLKPILKEGFASELDDIIKVDSIMACNTINKNIEQYQNIIDTVKKDANTHHSINSIMKFIKEFKKAYTKYECSSLISTSSESSKEIDSTVAPK